MFLNEMYKVIFLLSLLFFILLFVFYRKRTSNYYLLLFGAILISNFGYMTLSDSMSLQMAILSNQIVYLGASFSPFFMMMCLVDICKVKVPPFVQILCIIYGVGIYFLVALGGDFKLYYTFIDFARDNGVTYLIKEYGPLHNFYPLYLFACILFGLFSVIMSFKKKKDVSYVSSVILLLMLLIIVATYVVEKALKLKLEIIPFAYIICEPLTLILLKRVSLFNVAAVSKDAIDNTKSQGFVLFDSKERFLGADDVAKKFFPEFSNMPLDRRIHGLKTPILEQMDQWIHKEDLSDTEVFPVGDSFIEATHVVLEGKRGNGVHCVYLRDDTMNQKYRQYVENYNERLANDVEEKTEQIRKIQDDIIVSMASIVENRDNNTGGHVKRTSDIMQIFVKHLEETDEFPEIDKHTAKRIIKAAPLHDFGKIAIPDVILNKPGKFTDEEYKEMQKHPEKGAVIVEQILQSQDDLLFKKIAVNVAHFHHEKWNGTGYPMGLKGEEIPFEARAMALADVFDALVSKRVYKERFSYDKAFSIIEESLGSHFDERLGKEFLKCRPLLEELYDSYLD